MQGEANIINVTKASLPALDRYLSYLQAIWSNNQITNNGPLVRELEQTLTSYLDTAYLVLVNNGTSALQLAIRALGLKTGEIITTPFTFAATVNSILLEGLTPIFVDIDPNTYTINPNEIANAITDKTIGIMAVHVYGNACDIEAIQAIADQYNLRIIYDAAHAFDVKYNDKSIVNYGDISTLSFHATKVFNTIEGGALACRNSDIYEQLKLLRNFGIKSEEEIVSCGINAKMNEFQAAMGLCNLPTIKNSIYERSQRYFHYQDLLDPSIGRQDLTVTYYNYSYMPVRFKSQYQRDRVYLTLKEQGINARKYFYPLLSDLDYLKSHSRKVGSLYNASNLANTVLCLPLYEDLDYSDIDRIIEIVNRAIM